MAVLKGNSLGVAFAPYLSTNLTNFANNFIHFNHKSNMISKI